MSDGNHTYPISNQLKDNGSISVSQKITLAKAFRSATGTFLTADATVTNSATLATVSAWSFPVKANKPYVVNFDFFFNVWAGAGPLGNVKVELVLPAHTTNFTFDGQATYVISGSAGTIIQLGSAANTPYASPQVASVQGINATIVSANTATAAYSSNLTGLAYLVPQVDDVLQVQFAQAAASATGSTILQSGSFMNVLGLAQNRKTSSAASVV